MGLKTMNIQMKLQYLLWPSTAKQRCVSCTLRVFYNYLQYDGTFLPSSSSFSLRSLFCGTFSLLFSSQDKRRQPDVSVPVRSARVPLSFISSSFIGCHGPSTKFLAAAAAPLVLNEASQYVCVDTLIGPRVAFL